MAFPAFRPGLGLAVSSPTDLHGLPFSTTGGFPACGRPLLAFASCMDSVVTSPTRRAPKGPSMRVHTRPLPSRDCRAVVPSQQRSFRGSRAPGGAAAGQVPRSSSRRSGPSPTRGPAGVVPGAQQPSPCRSVGLPLSSRASSTRPVPPVRRASGSSEEGFRRSMPFTRPGSCGADCEQPATMSLAGLLSWCSQRFAPPSTSASCVHSQHTAVLVRTRCSPR
jgi:hypothetical protein